MIDIRKANDRGLAQLGWLTSHHTFSFSQYWDPAQQGFSDLLVINDDTVTAGMGFPTHPHADMEIFSYVLSGALAHQDTIGDTIGPAGSKGGGGNDGGRNSGGGGVGAEGGPVGSPVGTSVIGPGDVQMMSAGTGIRHSEFNASTEEPVHFLQIWIVPEPKGVRPRYAQKHFAPAEKQGRLRLIIAPNGEGDALPVYQDVRVYAGMFTGSQTAELSLGENRFAYVHVARGTLEVNGVAMGPGDGARVRREPRLSLARGQDAEVLVFDLRPHELPQMD